MRSFATVRGASEKSVVVDDLSLSLLRNFHVLLVCENTGNTMEEKKKSFLARFLICLATTRLSHSNGSTFAVPTWLSHHTKCSMNCLHCLLIKTKRETLKASFSSKKRFYALLSKKIFFFMLFAYLKIIEMWRRVDNFRDRTQIWSKLKKFRGEERFCWTNKIKYLHIISGVSWIT